MHNYGTRGCIVLIMLGISSFLLGQKEVYIPQDWLQGNFDYSLERSAASDNFVVFWGPLAGLDPMEAPQDIAFDPQEILGVAEDLYTFYIDSLRFIPSQGPFISEWKMILVMLHTWEGIEGWAFGGNYDGQTGAMWMHPRAASDGPTLAHEFAHALQNYTWMMNPGNGFVNHSYVGFFWETHAEFMALQYFPQVARYFDISRWMNTAQYHWSSTRHHYQAFVFLQYIKERHGLELINRMWNESLIGEHPLQTYKRLTQQSQEDLNDRFGEYSARNVQWDYQIGDRLREASEALPYYFALNTRLVPEKSSEGHYKISDHRAPQDYGYNIIRIFPSIPDSCDRNTFFLKFKGHRAHSDAGWRYSLVALDGEGNPRYSPLYKEDQELEFEVLESDSAWYLVVMGAPQVHHNYDWEPGFPKIYRYPYEFSLIRAFPEGYQEGYSPVEGTFEGGPHSLGGGFVAHTAWVDPTAYVGPNARVLESARVLQGARIEGFAVVRDRAIVGEQARVSDYAVVGGDSEIMGEASVGGFARLGEGNRLHEMAHVGEHSCIFYTRVSGQAQVMGNGFCWGANLSGTVYLGGDAEYFRPCSEGTYYQVQGAQGRDCDGRTDHPADIDINVPYLPFQAHEMLFASDTGCKLPTRIAQAIRQYGEGGVFPNPFQDRVYFKGNLFDAEGALYFRLWSWEGRLLRSGVLMAENAELNTGDLSPGLYILGVRAGDGAERTFKLVKE
jgi:hypothetical protein